MQVFRCYIFCVYHAKGKCGHWSQTLPLCNSIGCLKHSQHLLVSCYKLMRHRRAKAWSLHRNILSVLGQYGGATPTNASGIRFWCQALLRFQIAEHLVSAYLLLASFGYICQTHTVTSRIPISKEAMQLLGSCKDATRNVSSFEINWYAKTNKWPWNQLFIIEHYVA